MDERTKAQQAQAVFTGENMFPSAEELSAAVETTPEYQQAHKEQHADLLMLQYSAQGDGIKAARSYGYTDEEISNYLNGKESLALLYYSPEEVNKYLGRTPENMKFAAAAERRQKLDMYSKVTGLSGDEIENRMFVASMLGMPASMLINDSELYNKLKPKFEQQLTKLHQPWWDAEQGIWGNVTAPMMAGAGQTLNSTLVKGTGFIAAQAAPAYNDMIRWGVELLQPFLNDIGLTPDKTAFLYSRENNAIEQAAKWTLDKGTEIDKAINEWHTQQSGENPSFTAETMHGVGSSLAFLVSILTNPLYGASMESLGEAGDVMAKALEKGKYDQSISPSALSFITNMVANYAWDKMGFFNPLLDKIKNPYLRGFARVISEVPFEIGQETGQEVTGNAADKTVEQGGNLVDYAKNLWREGKNFWEIAKELAPTVGASTLITGGFGAAIKGRMESKEEKAAYEAAKKEWDALTPEQKVEKEKEIRETIIKEVSKSPLFHSEEAQNIHDGLTKRFMDGGRPEEEAGYLSKLLTAFAIVEKERNPGAKKENGEALSLSDMANVVVESWEKSERERTEEENYDQVIGMKGAKALDAADENTIRQDNYQIALKMREAGKDAKTIKLATGWEWGADGKEKYEIMDGEVKLPNPDGDLTVEEARELNELDMRFINGTDLTEAERARVHELSQRRLSPIDEKIRLNRLELGDIYDAPELYKAYPELKDMPVTFENLKETRGEYSHLDGIILSRNFLERNASVQSAKSTLVHEIQHAIQHIEGFGLGGSSTGAWVNRKLRPHTVKEYEKILKESRVPQSFEEYINSQWDGEDTPESRANYQEYVNDLKKPIEPWMNKVFQESAGERVYKRLSGETEARNASTRMDMTAEERRNSLLEETEDVAREDQIVLRDDNGAVESYAQSMPKAALADMDKRYMAAVEAGDMETAQKIVDARARDMGYISDDEYRMSHRAPNSHDEDITVNMADAMNGEIVPDDYWTHPEWYGNDRAENYQAFSAVKRAIEQKKQREAEGSDKPVLIRIYRAVPKTLKETDFRNGDWVTPSKAYAELHGESNVHGGYRIISHAVDIRNLWWDANSINEWGYDDGKSYAYKDTKNNRKLTDAVVRDKDGNIVPPSKRFNSRKTETYYQNGHTAEGQGFYNGLRLPFDPAELRTESGKTIEEAAKSDMLVTPDGSKALGRIEQAVAEFPAGEIQANVGALDYIEDTHGEELRDFHYDNAQTLLLDVLNNYTEIRRGEGKALILSAPGDARHSVKSVVKLVESQKGIYRVSDAGIVRNDYLTKKELLSSRVEIPDTGPDSGLAYSPGHIQNQGMPDIDESQQSNSENSLQRTGETVNATTSWESGTAAWEAPSVIEFLETANASSGFHEIGHHMLRVMVDISKLEGASAQLKDDVNTILTHAGVTMEEFETDRNKRKQAHEFFARSWETYLSEGKAPTAELQGVFDRIRQWMIEVYHDVVQALGIKLSDDMRDVFDRLLATPEQLAEQKSIGDLAVEEMTRDEEIKNVRAEIEELEAEGTTPSVTPDGNAQMSDEAEQKALEDISAWFDEQAKQNGGAESYAQEAVPVNMAAEMRSMVDAEPGKHFYRIPDLRAAMREKGVSDAEFEEQLKQLRDAEIIQLHSGDVTGMTEQQARDRFTDENGFTFGTFSVFDDKALNEAAKANAAANPAVSTTMEERDTAGTTEETPIPAPAQAQPQAIEEPAAETVNTETEVADAAPDTTRAIDNNTRAIDAIEDYTRAIEEYEIKKTAREYVQNIAKIIRDNGGLRLEDFIGNLGEELAKGVKKKWPGLFRNTAQGPQLDLDQMTQQLQANGINLDVQGLVDWLQNTLNERLVKPVPPTLSGETLTAAVDKYGAEKVIDYLNERRKYLNAQNRKEESPDALRTINKELRAIDRLIVGDKAARKAQKLKEHYQDWISRLKAENREKVKAAVAKEREKGKERLDERIAKLKQHYAAMVERKAERKKIGQAIDKAVRAINRMADAKSISYDRQQEIKALLKDYDLHKRNGRTLDRRARVAELLELKGLTAEDAARLSAEDMAFLDITENDLKYIGTTALNSMSLLDVLELQGRVEDVFLKGKEEYAAWEAKFKQERDTIRGGMKESLDKRKGPDAQVVKNRKDMGKQYDGIIGKLAKIKDGFYSAVLNLDRLCDWFDGGHGKYKGAFVRNIADRLNAATDEAKLHTHERYNNMKKALKDLGFRVSDFSKKAAEINGTAWTYDEIMELYIGMRNDKKAKAIIYGNFVNGNGQGPVMSVEEAQNTIRELVGKLTPEHMMAAELVIQDHEANFERLNKKLIEATNRGMEHELDYSSIHRLEHQTKYGLIDEADEAAMERGLDEAAIMKQVEKGFMLSRQEIADEHQAPITLGLFANWMADVSRHEQAAAMARTGRLLTSALMSGGEEKRPLLKQLADKFGTDARRALVSTFNDSVTDGQRLAQDFLGKLSDTVARNMSITYIAGNMGTVMKQLTSIPRFLITAGPLRLIGATMRFAINPMRFLENAYKLDPQLRDRGGSALLQAILQSPEWGQRAYQKGLQWMFAPVSIVDRWVAAIGWMATYEANLAKGATEEHAMREAQRAVRLTQQAASAKDLPRLWRGGGFVKTVMAFTSDTAGTIGMSAYDMVQQLTSGELNQTMKVFSTAFALSMTAMFMKAATSGLWGSDDDDDDDPQGFGSWWAEAMVEEFITSLPLIGKEAMMLYEELSGKYRGTTYSAFLTPVVKACKAIKLFTDEDSEEEEFWKASGMMLDALALSGITQVPSTAIRRLVQSAVMEDGGDAVKNLFGMRVKRRD